MLIERRTRDATDFPEDGGHPLRVAASASGHRNNLDLVAGFALPRAPPLQGDELDPVHDTSQRRQRVQAQRECNGGEIEADWAAAGRMQRVNHPMLNIGMQEVRSGVVVLSGGLDLRRADGLTNEIVTRLVGQRSGFACTAFAALARSARRSRCAAGGSLRSAKRIQRAGLLNLACVQTLHEDCDPGMLRFPA